MKFFVSSFNVTRFLSLLIVTCGIAFNTTAQAGYCKPQKLKSGCSPFAADYFVANPQTQQFQPMQVWYTDQGTFYKKANGELTSWHPKGKKLKFNRWITDSKLVIEYEASDLASLGQNVSWEQVRGLLASKQLDTLHQAETMQWNRHNARRLTNNDHSYQVELIDQYQIPARVIQNGQPTMVLARLYQTEEVVGWLAQLSTFDRMDYADLGDSESDPRVAKLIHQGFVPGHASHSHGH